MADKVRMAIDLLRSIEKEQRNANSSQTSSIQAAIKELERLDSSSTSEQRKSKTCDKRVLQILGSVVAGFTMIKRLIDFLSEVDDG